MMDFINFRLSPKKISLSIIKIIICSIVIGVSIYRSKLFIIPDGFVNILLSVISVALTFLGILKIYISVSEISILCEKEAEKKKLLKLKSTEIRYKRHYSIDEVVDLIENNDIIEFVIKNEKGISKIGSSSDNYQASSEFFDKRYYINEYEYTSFSDFVKCFEKGIGAFDVISIDGIYNAQRHNRS